jgi:pimeloyl-ACP methyl ester carboxylesterase
MFKKTIGIIITSLLFASHAYADMPKGEYLDGGSSKSAVILAHGQGLGPTSQVVDPLRKNINKELGMHTLSLQMPVVPGKHSNESYIEYEATFPEAYKSIQDGIAFMKDKGVQKIYLMGYSMGARMTTAFLADHADSGVAGYIGVGMLGGGQPPMNTNVNLRKVLIPVLDIYADSDNDAKFAQFRKSFISDRYTQISIAGAKHDFRCCESDVSQHVVKWLKDQDQKN